MDSEEAQSVLLEFTPEFLADLFEALGFDPSDAPEAVEHQEVVFTYQGYPIGFRHSPHLNGILVSGVVFEATGLNIEDILFDLLLLNGRLDETGGIVFGLRDRETIVASIVVADTLFTAQNIAAAVDALADAIGSWRELIEQTLANPPSDQDADGEKSGSRPIGGFA